MTPLQLATIVKWAGTLRTRKRLQKVVYLLQVKDAPIIADYTLHHYGPYSSDVARLVDQLVQRGLLVEQAESNAIGNQFSYTLSESAVRQLAELEQNPERISANDITQFEGSAKTLLAADLKDLEIAATISYFRKQGKNWPEAVQSTAQFKSIPFDGSRMTRGLELARSLMP